jgi:DUF1680 family protein
LLGGVTVLRSNDGTAATKPSLMAIPYYAWSNRGDGEMCVWIKSDTLPAATP